MEGNAANAGVDRAIRLSTELFLRIELVVYVALGILLSVTALLSLGSAALLLLEGMRDWSGTRAIFLIVDRLMFVLMLIEILHTVRGSVRSGALTPEPFLIIGLIAAIRRVLVLTAEFGEVRGNDSVLKYFVTEIAALTVLILVLVGALVLLRRLAAPVVAERAPSSER